MMNQSILIVDDEASMREFLSILLEREGYVTRQAETAEKALEFLDEIAFDLVISDVKMPGLDGIALLQRIREKVPDTAVLLVTAYTTAEQAVEAMKLGAYDYIAKPFKVEEVKVLVRNALEKRELYRENLRLRHEVSERYSFAGLIGKSTKMRELYALIEKVSASSANVLILGESGTGKELAAKAIHYNGVRKGKPFVAINCGAIPETLIEGEFFGHKRGAFTGAIADKPGLFEQAEGGTLFLDEIGEVPLLLQAKLLRVLQEREFRRIGATSSMKADVRIIAASNRDLEGQVKDGTFREDLYYRLNVIQLEMPPLRQRTEDIPILIEHFFEKVTGKHIPVKEGVSAGAMQCLLNYHFPGNVRELENLVERYVVMGEAQVTTETLPTKIVSPRAMDVPDPVGIPDVGMDLEAYLDGIEKRFLEQALERSNGNKTRAAEMLGLSFRSIRYRLKKFGMDD